MINIVGTDTITVVTGSAVTVDVHASYMDHNGLLREPDRDNTLITTAATTTVVAAPGTDQTRMVQHLTVHNKHTSSSCDVTVNLVVSSTSYQLRSMTLGAGQTLAYLDGKGWYTC